MSVSEVDDAESEAMSSLKSIAQQAVVNAGLESQIPASEAETQDSRGESRLHHLHCI